MVSPALGLGGPQSPWLWRQALWDGPLQEGPRGRFRPKEVRRPHPLGMWRAEGRAKVRALGSVSMVLSLLARGAFEVCWGLRA